MTSVFPILLGFILTALSLVWIWHLPSDNLYLDILAGTMLIWSAVIVIGALSQGVRMAFGIDPQMTIVNIQPIALLFAGIYGSSMVALLVLSELMGIVMSSVREA